MSARRANKKLVEMAKVIRSKNSGPFKLTLDIIFDSADEYRSIKASGQVTRELIAGLYGIETALIAEIIFFDPASAIKVVLPRPVVSGGPGDTDVYGAQQHAPLLALSFEIEEE
ncbi:MAG: DUF4387 domain-containing protein [Spirochaetaceae bacterium]|nr:MAG: DUF4387 domain-containing protein [Spirochaetaceae bacterium]